MPLPGCMLMTLRIKWWTPYVDYIFWFVLCVHFRKKCFVHRSVSFTWSSLTFKAGSLIYIYTILGSLRFEGDGYPLYVWEECSAINRLEPGVLIPFEWSALYKYVVSPALDTMGKLCDFIDWLCDLYGSDLCDFYILILWFSLWH